MKQNTHSNEDKCRLDIGTHYMKGMFLLSLVVCFLLPFFFSCNYGPKVKYRVQHWKQNLEDEKPKFFEEEWLEGVAGKHTKAVSKNYPGFTPKKIEQKKIEADETTVVNVYYDRKTVKVTFDPNGGTLDDKTPGEEKDGKKIIEGLFESAMPKIPQPTGNDKAFSKWEPELPKTFPADDTVYVAQWGASYKITVKGDDRTEQDASKIPTILSGGIWRDIKEKVEDALAWKADWRGGDYHGYEWHLNDENGDVLNDNYEVNSDITVYAITNYKPFKMYDSFLAGIDGSEPKGRIYIPKKTTIINERAFQKRDGAVETGFRGITNVIFKGCSALDEIKEYAFGSCEGILTVEFPDTSGVKTIDKYAFSFCSKLQTLNLKGCVKLTTIGNAAFANCGKLESLDFSSCLSLKDIGEEAFQGCDTLKSVNFAGCSKLAQLPRAVFSGCSSLKEIDFTSCSSLNSIGIHTFSSCESLENVDLTPCNNLTSIGAWAFYGDANATITLPASITTIGVDAFGRATPCKKVIVPNDAVKQLVIKANYPEEKITVKS